MESKVYLVWLIRRISVFLIKKFNKKYEILLYSVIDVSSPHFLVQSVS